MNKHFWILALAMLWQNAFADNFAYNGCQYQGSSLHGKPQGQGVLTCPDGRVYTGAFKQGLFHGKGQYIIPNQHSLSLPPFGMNSDKLKGMVLSGTFADGVAHGAFKVYQNGQHLFNFRFKNGIATDMQLAK